MKMGGSRGLNIDSALCYIKESENLRSHKLKNKFETMLVCLLGPCMTVD
jgi:hypothetical protein